MNLPLSDPQKQTVIAALEFFRNAKQLSLSEKNYPFQKTSEYDLLSVEHSLMHSITLLAKLTDRPLEHFANPNPSQNQNL